MRALGIALILLGAAIVVGVPALVAWVIWNFTAGFSVSTPPYGLAAVLAFGVGAIVAGAWLIRRAAGPARPRSR